MSDRPPPRPTQDASRWLEGRLECGERVLAAIEGQRETPRRVWIATTLVLFIVVGSLIPGFWLKILAIIPVAIIATRIAAAAGARITGGEIAGFGMSVAVTDRAIHVQAHRGLSGGGHVHGPYARAGVDVTLKRRLLSNSIIFSGAFALSLRTAPGSPLDGFLEVVDPLDD